VAVVSVAEIPAGATRLKPSKGRRHVLAEGEVTGHAHAVSARDVEMFEAGGERFLQVNAAATIGHEEHAPITLEPGVYRIIHQVEYTPAEIRADLHLRGADLPQTRAQLMASVDVMVERGFGDGIFDRARRTEAEIAAIDEAVVREQERRARRKLFRLHAREADWRK